MNEKFIAGAMSEIKNKIDALLCSRELVLAAIDGNSGAGKSTLAGALNCFYECNVFHMDDFFLPPELKTPERLSEAGGNIDYVRFKTEIIEGIKSRREFEYRVYDCSVMKLTETVSVQPRKLNIIEGVYSMHPMFADAYDLRIFLRIGKDEQRRRILERSGEKMLKRFVNEWIPMEDRFFQELRVKDACDLVFDEERP
jgi:uridine kinase